MYTVTYHCSNCDHTFTKQFKYGEAAPSTVECYACGCSYARKVMHSTPKAPWRPWAQPYKKYDRPDFWLMTRKDITGRCWSI